MFGSKWDHTQNLFTGTSGQPVLCTECLGGVWPPGSTQAITFDCWSSICPQDQQCWLPPCQLPLHQSLIFPARSTVLITSTSIASTLIIDPTPRINSVNCLYVNCLYIYVNCWSPQDQQCRSPLHRLSINPLQIFDFLIFNDMMVWIDHLNLVLLKCKSNHQKVTRIFIAYLDGI